jgi:hypothetical protein
MDCTFPEASALAYPDHGKDAEIILKKADSAMFVAKTGWHDQFQIFRPDTNLHALERDALEYT